MLSISRSRLATIGYGDFSFDSQPAWLRWSAIVVMMATVVLLATFYALVTEYPGQSPDRGDVRSGACDGYVATRDRDRTGPLGISVVERLVAMNQSVVVVERDQNNRHIGRRGRWGAGTGAGCDPTRDVAGRQPPRRAGGRRPDFGRVRQHRVRVGGRDTLGLRAADVPVVMRVFDRRLGGMLEERLHFHHVRSVSAVSAPWFVAAALGLEVIATFAVDQETFIAGRLTVRAGGLAGASMLDLPMQARVMALFREGGLSTCRAVKQHCRPVTMPMSSGRQRISYCCSCTIGRSRRCARAHLRDHPGAL